MVALAFTVLGMIYHLFLLLVDKMIQLAEHSVFFDDFLSPDWVKMIFIIIFWLFGFILANGAFGLAHNFLQTSKFSVVRAFCEGTSFLLPLLDHPSLAS